MLQIKTIVDTDSNNFDTRVNGNIGIGYQLTKRYYVPTLGWCAEMEREVVAPHEHNCSTCRYGDQDGGEPCDSCAAETWDQWEPQEGAIVMVPLTKR